MMAASVVDQLMFLGAAQMILSEYALRDDTPQKRVDTMARMSNYFADHGFLQIFNRHEAAFVLVSAAYTLLEPLKYAEETSAGRPN